MTMVQARGLVPAELVLVPAAELGLAPEDLAFYQRRRAIAPTMTCGVKSTVARRGKLLDICRRRKNNVS
jgi:hypothetical protein